MVTKVKLFLASSDELLEDRKEFEIFINRKSKDWVDKRVFIELLLWEDALESMSRTRLQDEYNHRIRSCDLFVMLFFTKVGQYTEEEFETAFGQFQSTNKPFIFTYFKDAPINTGSINREDLMSLLAFQKKLDELGHFYSTYTDTNELAYKFNRQLDKLAANRFIEFQPAEVEAAAASGDTNSATLVGDGAIAQGGGNAIGARGVYVGGNSTGDFNTGIQKTINTGGGDFVGRDRITEGLSSGDIESLFAPLLAAVSQHAPSDQQAKAVRQVQQLQAEVAKGKGSEDGKVATILNGLVSLVPGAVSTVVSAFASPVLDGIAGPVTRIVLDKLRPS